MRQCAASDFIVCYCSFFDPYANSYSHAVLFFHTGHSVIFVNCNKLGILGISATTLRHSDCFSERPMRKLDHMCRIALRELLLAVLFLWKRLRVLWYWMQPSLWNMR
jgi:hypothetical protein